MSYVITGIHHSPKNQYQHEDLDVSMVIAIIETEDSFVPEWARHYMATRAEKWTEYTLWKPSSGIHAVGYTPVLTHLVADAGAVLGYREVGNGRIDTVLVDGEPIGLRPAS